MSVNIEVRGLDKLLRRLDRIEQMPRTTAMNRALTAGAYVVETNAKLLINTGTKSGNAYIRGGKTHVASAPGEAPATDTGMLVNSISTYSPLGAMNTVVVGATAEYAVYLEFGTSRMEARPFMRPALQDNLDNVVKAIKNELSRALMEYGI